MEEEVKVGGKASGAGIGGGSITAGSQEIRSRDWRRSLKGRWKSRP
jgi:mevalonate kinase